MRIRVTAQARFAVTAGSGTASGTRPGRVSEFAGVGRPQFGSPAVTPGPRAFGRITPFRGRPTEATGPEIAEEIPACSGAGQAGLCGLLHLDLA
jgi:hypothetical protein